MANPWITFLAKFRKSNPKLSMKAAMREGAKVYRSQKGKAGKAGKAVKAKRKGKKKVKK